MDELPTAIVIDTTPPNNEINEIIVDLPISTFQNPSSNNSFFGEYPAADTAGRLVTAGAMAGQGILGFLLFYNALEETSVVLGITVGGVIGLGSFIGKYALVRHFNTPTWRNLKADLIPCKTKNPDSGEIDEASGWTAIGVLNGIVSIIPASCFAYINDLSFRKISELIGKISSTPAAQEAAGVFAHPATRAVFSGCAFIGNLLSFPNIHKYGMPALISRSAYYAVENPEYRKEIEILSLRIESARIHIKNQYEQRSITNRVDAATLTNPLMENTDINSINANTTSEDILNVLIQLLNNANTFNQKNKVEFQSREQWHEWYAKNFAAALTIGTVLTGFYGFFPTMVSAVNYLPSLIIGSSFVVPIGVSYPIAAACYLSVACMAGGPADYVRQLIGHQFGHREGVNILPPWQRILSHLFAVITVLAGSAPYIKQEMLELLGRLMDNLPLIVLGSLASSIVEYEPIHNMIYNKFLQRKLSRDLTANDIYETDKLLLKASELLSQLSEEDANTLMKTFPSVNYSTPLLQTPQGSIQDNTENSPITLDSGSESSTDEDIEVAKPETKIPSANPVTQNNFTNSNINISQYLPGYQTFRNFYNSLSCRTCIFLKRGEKQPLIPQTPTSKHGNHIYSA